MMPTSFESTTPTEINLNLTMNGTISDGETDENGTNDTDDTWFITSIVFICAFGGLLCLSVYLAYAVYKDPSSGKKYKKYKKPSQQVEATKLEDSE